MSATRHTSTNATRSDPGSARIGRPNADALTALLDKLDALDDSGSSHRNKRQSVRCTFRRCDVNIRIHHPGGTTTARAVATRNLSANGIGFLYPSFIHTGTSCEVTLTRRLGGADLIKGKVVFCAHVGGVFHQVGMKFDEKIFPRLYLDPGSYAEVEADVPSDVTSLKGNVLYIDDQEMDRLLMTHHLKATSIRLTSVATQKDALAELQRTNFDVVLIDLNLETATGEEVVKLIRTGGYTGPVAAVTGETSPMRLQAAQSAGASAILAKPYEQPKLLALLGTWLNGATPSDPIYSTVEAGSDLAPMLAKYVENVRTLAQQLQVCADKDNFDKLRNICVALKGSGSGYGFGTVSDAAKEAVKNLDATMSAAESAVQVQRLIDICKRVSVRV